MKNINMMIWMILFFIATLLAACGGASSQKTPTTIPITYPTAEYTNVYNVVKTGNNELITGPAGTLPNDLPRDVPVYYPGFTTGWMMGKVSGKLLYIEAGIQTPDANQTVMNWYRSALESSGWVIGPPGPEPYGMVCQNGKIKPEIIDAEKGQQALRVSMCPSSCTANCEAGISLYYSEIE
jgi:hypothetical protein